MDIPEIYKKFPNETDCIEYLEKIRWGHIPVCPYCNSKNSTPLNGENRHHCNTCNTSFSVTVKTILHRSHLPLQKWFLAICLLLNAKKGISARQLAREIRVNKDTAWSIGMKIRRSMLNHRDWLLAIAEMDGTYMGGKPRHSGGNSDSKRGRGTFNTPVVGMAKRGGKIRAKGAKKMKAKTLNSLGREKI